MAKYGILKSATNTGIDSELSTIFAAPLTVRSNQPSFVSDSISLKRRAASQGIQRWEIQANIMPTNGSVNFLTHSIRHGHSSLFYVRMPQVHGSKKASTSKTFRLSSPANAGDDLIYVGFQPSTDPTQVSSTTSHTFEPGEFFTIAGDPKVYMVLDVDVDGNFSKMRIYPKLLKPHLRLDQVVMGDKVTMRAYYDTDTVIGITYSDGILSDPGSITLVEAL